MTEETSLKNIKYGNILNISKQINENNNTKISACKT